jgi:hypothetical protein
VHVRKGIWGKKEEVGEDREKDGKISSRRGE